MVPIDSRALTMAGPAMTSQREKLGYLWAKLIGWRQPTGFEDLNYPGPAHGPHTAEHYPIRSALQDMPT